MAMNLPRPTRRAFLRDGSLAVAALAYVGRPSARAAGDDPPVSADSLMARGVAFLRTRQDENGGWSTTRNEPGITALVVTALLKTKLVTPAEPVITKGLGYLEQFVRPQGGFEGAHANYTTSIALMAYKEANAGGKFDTLIHGGQDFLKTMQWDETEGKDPKDPFYGGAGYGGTNSRPDLSNTAFMFEALRETGLPADDPSLQKALQFVSRCQNFESEFNDQPWAGKVNDGGFIYTAANGGSSMAGETENGGLRSYGSMTYAGFKSLIYAGLTKDDPRVKAALDYIKKSYTLDENPGMGDKGLYYYYQAFSKAMSAMGDAVFLDAKGTRHDWRAELVAALAKRQSADGGWVNPADRFMEGDPNLVTAYSLIALSYTRKASAHTG
jgi:squalene-hopene/tetraprenyl-beta-curcumene cyclase